MRESYTTSDGGALQGAGARRHLPQASASPLPPDAMTGILAQKRGAGPPRPKPDAEPADVLLTELDQAGALRRYPSEPWRQLVSDLEPRGGDHARPGTSR